MKSLLVPVVYSPSLSIQRAPSCGLTHLLRFVYYQNPELFGNQRYVDQLVDDIAFTFGVNRDALNIVCNTSHAIRGRGPQRVQVAASKGLVAGGDFRSGSDDSVSLCRKGVSS